MTSKYYPFKFYIKSNWRHFVLGLTFLFLTNILDSTTPMVLKWAIDSISSKSLTSETPRNIALVFFILMGSLGISRFLWRWFWTQFHTKVAEQLRNSIFEHLLQLGPTFYTRAGIGQIMSVISSDVQVFRNGIGPGLLVLIDGVSLILIIIPAMFLLNSKWALFSVVCMVPLPILVHKLSIKIGEISKVNQDRLARVSEFAQEAISANKLIKLFNLSSNRLQKYRELNDDLKDGINYLNYLDAWYEPIMQVTVILATIFLLVFGGLEVIDGVTTLGTFLAFQRYINKLLWPISALGYGISQIQKASSCYERIDDLIKVKKEFPTIMPELKKQIDIHSLELRNISLTIGQSNLIKNVSFRAELGELIGITGPVGAGKSIIADVLNCYQIKTDGEYKINGKEFQYDQRDDIWRQIKTVNQEPFIFNGTILENLKIAKEGASENEILDVLSCVELLSDINELSNGLNTIVGEKGIQLSGGQRQRLALARVLLTNPKVLILDDTLSALDIPTEARISNRILLPQLDKIKFVISHRASVLSRCTRILVMENGILVSSGSHNDLLDSNVYYKNQWHQQGAQ